MTNWIDVKFNFYSDTPSGKDPDSYSPTLRRYHQILWSKPLKSGIIFKLNKNTRKVLHHESQLGEFFLSSDSIAHTYRYTNSMNHIINDISLEEIESFYSLCSTIGGYIIFPSKKIDNKMTINGARGINSKIRDRFDLTLECIRRYYIKEQSPLGETLKRYSSFFDLFDNFKGYVDFFLLNDLVNEKYSSIKYFIPFESFEKSPLPRDVQEYKLYKKNMTNFISARNQRIVNDYNNVEL